jgi:hypothetical protein
MFDAGIAMGDMVWTVAEDDETAPAPMCLASREWITMYQADLAAHRRYVQRTTRTSEDIRRVADELYDASIEHARANGMHVA